LVHRNPNSDGAQDGATPAPLRRKKGLYQAPRILSREPLEVMAATCSGAKVKAVSGITCTKLKS